MLGYYPPAPPMPPPMPEPGESDAAYRLRLRIHEGEQRQQWRQWEQEHAQHWQMVDFAVKLQLACLIALPIGFVVLIVIALWR
jgi:hypothetical protein